MEHHGVCTENVGYLIFRSTAPIVHISEITWQEAASSFFSKGVLHEKLVELESKRSGEFCFKAS